MNCTALIFYHPDSPERARNLDAVMRWLSLHKIPVNIAAGPQYFHEGIIHRTRALNDLAREARSEYVIIQDTDAVIPSTQIQEALEFLSHGVDFVWPYDGTFWRCAESPSQAFSDTLDIVPLMNTEDKRISIRSVGGCVFVNRKRYLECGGENETFIGYAPEDLERAARLSKLGSTCAVKGALYHLNHPMLAQSTPGMNPFFQQGNKEYAKVQRMTPEELRAYVDTWTWRKKQ